MKKKTVAQKLDDVFDLAPHTPIPGPGQAVCTHCGMVWDLCDIDGGVCIACADDSTNVPEIEVEVPDDIVDKLKARKAEERPDSAAEVPGEAPSD